MNLPLIRKLFYIVERVIAGNFSDNRDLKNRYSGKKCFIFGTGAHLNDVNFSDLADEYVFGCNLLFKHKDFASLNVNFYSVIMHYFGFVYKDREIIYEGISNASLNDDALVFLRGLNKPFIEQKGYIRNYKKIYICAGSDRKITSNGSVDLAGGVDYMNGVIFFQMAAAIYMGFKEIYLLGCGYTTSPRQLFHFYDEPPYFEDCSYPWQTPNFDIEIPPSERTMLAEQFASARGLQVHSSFKSLNHETFRMIDKTAECAADYYHMRDLASSYGSKIFNIVPPGFKSPVFDKRSFSEALA